MYILSQGRDAVKIHVQIVSMKRCCKDTCTNCLNEEMM